MVSSGIAHRMDLVGMKFIHEMPYFNGLPTGFIKCDDIKVFFKLKKGKRKVIKDNLEKIIDMEYIIYSPSSEHYWYRKVWEHTNMRKLYEIYFKDKNLYVTADARLPEDDDILDY